MKTCCVTGHRNIPETQLDEVRRQLDKEILNAVKDGFLLFLSGFADGTDLLFAEAVLKYKEQHPQLFLEAAIPYPNRIKTASPMFHRLFARCSGVHAVSNSYHPQCFQQRNRYMVQHSDRVIAVYDGRKNGETLFTMRYAHCLNKDLRLIRIQAGC